MPTESNADHEYDEDWDRREKLIERILGKQDAEQGHAILPFFMGGQADVLYFSNHVDGRAAVTFDLLADSGQIPNALGNFELMIAHRDKAEEWGSEFISSFASRTCDLVVQPGYTMGIRKILPEDSTLAAILFCEYARFKYKSKPAHLLLCLGITEEEERHCDAGRTREVLEALIRDGVYPFTDLRRESVRLAEQQVTARTKVARGRRALKKKSKATPPKSAKAKAPRGDSPKANGARKRK